MFIGLFDLCLRAVSCVYLPGVGGPTEWRWFYDGEVGCLASWQVGPLLLGVVLLPLPLIIPLLLARDTKGLVRIPFMRGFLRFFRSPFRQNRPAWFVVTAYTRVAAAIASHAIPNPFLAAGALTLIALLSLYLDVAYRPWSHARAARVSRDLITCLVVLSALQLRSGVLQSAGEGGGETGPLEVALAWCSWIFYILPAIVGVVWGMWGTWSSSDGRADTAHATARASASAGDDAETFFLEPRE